MRAALNAGNGAPLTPWEEPGLYPPVMKGEFLMKFTKQTSVADVVRICPSARRIFDKHGLRGCGGEHGPTESLAFFASVHEADVDALVEELNAELANPAPAKYVYEESLGDFIYRRFFKSAIAVVLTVGALWGATSLLQIAVGGSFLQVRLVPAIQAHAHAMIFGWVGLFVMGFAYQSFPRFKYVTLWRPDLANLTLYLMLIGILSRMGGELLLPMPVGIGLGILAAGVEIAAISLFILIILKTARKSIAPRNPYEKFIFASLFWFFVQALVSDLLFFAKATAVGQKQLIFRLALIDGPLRDIQLFGFAALIIAGVSQRFIPSVYGLGAPKHDRLSLIWWLMNGSLVLAVASYLLTLATGNLYFAAGLEAAYLLMVVWAVLLVLQLRIFAHPTQSDRSFKFIRGAYVWLLIAQAMLPFLIVYGVLMQQGFSHTFMGSHRHAFTVGFISLMIMGVSARVAPILAGIDSADISRLWGPFVLINVGCAGRVVLQVLTDFLPSVAFPLVGVTGFIEVAALAWWGWELWRVMNLSRSRRPQMLTTILPVPAK